MTKTLVGAPDPDPNRVLTYEEARAILEAQGVTFYD